MEINDISYDLLHRYNVQGPRYTSYPPAPSWSADLGPTDYEQIIRSSNETPSPVPISLYFHLPFCEALCYFCGCTTVITGKNRSQEMPYLTAVEKEIDWLAERVDRKRPVVQLHLGGGTPTYQSPDSLRSLIERVRTKFSVDAKAEMGVEVDPRVTTKAHLETLRSVGFNRVSMGVQDFTAAVQEAINRVQSFEMTRDLVQVARDLGYESVNMDLIYGLPHQTPDSFRQTIDQVLEINPDRLAVYSYAHVPWMKKHQDLFAAHLPDERAKFQIFLTALKTFTEAGFVYVGMDHFARPDDELARARENGTLWRNFQGYTTKAGTDLFGLGMSAIGNVNHNYIQNQKDLKAYQGAIAAGTAATLRGFRLSQDDQIRGRLIQNLLCHAVVKKADIETAFGITFDSYFADALTQLKVLEADGLVELNAREIRPTPAGRVFLRNIAMPFDAYLPKDGEKRMFSRTV